MRFQFGTSFLFPYSSLIFPFMIHAPLGEQESNAAAAAAIARKPKILFISKLIHTSTNILISKLKNGKNNKKKEKSAVVLT